MNAYPANSSSDKNKQSKNEKLNLKNLYERYLGELQEKFKEIEKNTNEIPKIDPDEFKNNSLPLARIKKIMKLDDEVKMISAETPILFSKACELFIVELAYRSWIHTLESNRRTLQRGDIANAISRTDFYDFLIDIVQESCQEKLHLCANFQMDPMNINFMQNYYSPQNINQNLNMSMYYPNNVKSEDVGGEENEIKYSGDNMNNQMQTFNPNVNVGKNGTNNNQFEQHELPEGYKNNFNNKKSKKMD